MGDELNFRSEWSGQLLRFAVPQHARLEMPTDPFYSLSKLVIILAADTGSTPCPDRNTIELGAGGDNNTGDKGFGVRFQEFRIRQVGVERLSNGSQHLCTQTRANQTTGVNKAVKNGSDVRYTAIEYPHAYGSSP